MAAADTLWSDDDRIVWLGQSLSGGKRLVMFDGSRLITLSNDAIDKIIDQEEATIDTAYGFAMRVGGHLLYLLTLPTAQGITLVCDLDTHLWTDWNSDDGSSESYFTAVDYTHDDGKHYLLDEDNGKAYEMDIDIFQDSGNDINVEIVTNKTDFDTHQNKFAHRLTLIGDEQTSASSITVDWTDDDYQNFSTSRTLDTSKSYPSLYNMGSFQRRAHRLKHTANTPLRLEGIELSVSLGDYQGGGF